MEKKGTPASPAMALASSVLPVPGTVVGRGSRGGVSEAEAQPAKRAGRWMHAGLSA